MIGSDLVSVPIIAKPNYLTQGFAMSTKNKITFPNTTQTPNILLDYWMAVLSLPAFKVIMFVTRETFGYGFRETTNKDYCSINLISERTGLNRDTVINAIKELCEYELIIKIPLGKANNYKINIYDPSQVGNTDLRCQVGNTDHNRSEIPTCNLQEHTYNTKEEQNKKRKKEDSFIPFSDFEEKIRNLLKPYEVDEAIIKLAVKETPEIVEQALKAADQFCLKKNIEDKLPTINKAIFEKWKPNKTETDILHEQSEKIKNLEEKSIQRKNECIELFREHEKHIKFKGTMEFKILKDRVEMRTGDLQWAIYCFKDPECVEILKKYIAERMAIINNQKG
jgi:hypothetical protein